MVANGGGEGLRVRRGGFASRMAVLVHDPYQLLEGFLNDPTIDVVALAAVAVVTLRARRTVRTGHRGRTIIGWVRQPGERHAAEAGAVHHDGRSLEPHEGLPGDRRCQPGGGRPSVADLMRKAGYDVTIQPYTFEYSSYVGTPSWSEVSPTARSFTLVDDWNPGKSNGDVTGAQVKPAGGIVLPPTPASSSTSGCTAADFSSGGYAGKIALIQRGGC